MNKRYGFLAREKIMNGTAHQITSGYGATGLAEPSPKLPYWATSHIRQTLAVIERERLNEMFFVSLNKILKGKLNECNRKNYFK